MQDHLSEEPDELEEFENTHNILIISSGQQITRIIPELHLAAWTGDLETVKLLTDKEHQNPLQKDECGNTALHIAAWGGTLNVLKYFVNEKECNPACPGPSGKTPLHYASQHAHLDVVKYLVTEKQVEPLCEDESRWTPLHVSCVSGCLSIVKFLIEEIQKYTPMKELMPSFTAKKNSSTPLHLAAGYGHIDIV